MTEGVCVLVYGTGPWCTPSSRPLMIPSIPCWSVGLGSRIFNRYAVPYALLLHRDSVEPSHLPLAFGSQPQIRSGKLFGDGDGPWHRRIGRYGQAVLSD